MSAGKMTAFIRIWGSHIRYQRVVIYMLEHLFCSAVLSDRLMELKQTHTRMHMHTHACAHTHTHTHTHKQKHKHIYHNSLVTDVRTPNAYYAAIHVLVIKRKTVSSSSSEKCTTWAIKLSKNVQHK